MLVYVEGPTDADILSELIDSRNLKFTPSVGGEYAAKKASENVGIGPGKFAVLDMVTTLADNLPGFPMRLTQEKMLSSSVFP